MDRGYSSRVDTPADGARDERIEQAMEQMGRIVGECDVALRRLTGEPTDGAIVPDGDREAPPRPIPGDGHQPPPAAGERGEAAGYPRGNGRAPGHSHRAAAPRPVSPWRGEVLLWWEDLWYGRWGRVALLALAVALAALAMWAVLSRARGGEPQGAGAEIAAGAAATPPLVLPAPGTSPVPGGLPATGPTPVPGDLSAPTTPAAPAGLIVFHSSQETPGTLQLYTVRAGEGDPVARRVPGTPRYAAHPRLSPDGARIAFAGGDAGGDDLYVIRPDGTGLTRLTRDRGRNRFPAWSPDGKQLAFGSDRDGNWEIYRLDLGSGVEARVTNHPADDNLPSWSPDGQWLAFQSDRDGGMHLFKLRADGGEVVQLTRGAGNDRYPAWSPDGRRLAFYSDRAGGLDQLFAVDADGRGETRLATTAGRDQLPSWSPDGRWLAFASERAGGWGIYLLGLDDGTERLLTGLADSWAPDWGSAR